MRSNLFALKGTEGAHLAVFSVAFKPEIKNVEARREAIESIFKAADAAYDGDGMLVARPDIQIVGSYPVGDKDGQVHVSSTGPAGPVFGPHASQPICAALLLRPHGMTQLSRNVFATEDISRGKAGPPGSGTTMVSTTRQLPYYTQSGRFAITSEVGATLLLRPMSVLDHLNEVRVNPTDANGMRDCLQGLRVTLEAMGRKGQRTVRSISREPCGRITFKDEESGREKTLVQHFQELYQIRVNPKHHALCTSTGEKAVYYPLEVCAIAAKQRPAQMNPILVDAVLKANTISPTDRAKITRPTLSPMAAASGLQVSTKPIEVRAEVLALPNLEFGGRKNMSSSSWNMSGIKVFNSVRKPIAWQLVVVSTRRGGDQKLAQNAQHAIESSFPTVFRNMGVNLDSKCSKLVSDYRQAKPLGDCSVVFVLLPDANAQRYREIKSFFHGAGMVSSCLLTKNIFRKGLNISPQYAGNLGLKINGKFGMINWTVTLPPLIRVRKPIQVFGFDVTHAPAGGVTPSTAALCGSIDPTMSTYAGRFLTLPPRTEEIGAVGFEQLVKPLVERFRAQNNGRQPEQILFLRDGVATSQYAYVVREELPVLRQLLPNAAVAFIIVTKRHHVRLYESNAKGLCNLPPSTVVSSPDIVPFVTLPGDKQQIPSFYLHPHNGRLGTSKTALCSVLCNDKATGWSQNDLQHLCNGFAHGHGTTTAAISLPSPVYHAHLLADKMRAIDTTVDKKLVQAIHDSRGQPWL